MKFLIFFATFITLLFPSGMAWGNGIDWVNGFVEVDGYGAPSTKASSSAQASLLAIRAAKADAYRNMLELVSGVRIDAQTTVKDMMVQNDRVNTQVSGFIQGAQVIRQERLYDGTCHIILRAPLYGVQGLQGVVDIVPETEHLNPETSQIILDKTGNEALLGTGDIHANLNWYHVRKNQVSIDESVDLDIGCFYEDQSHKSVMDALNQNFGDFNNPPYISIDVDDRSGKVASGENLLINGKQLKNFKRILIYSYIYKGISDWAALDSVVTISQSGNPDIVIRLDKNDSQGSMCAAAMIEQRRDGGYKITKLGDYFNNHSSMDHAYDWHFSWKAGQKN